MKAIAATLCLLTVVAGAVHAADAAPPTANVPHLSGGIGLDEREAMRSRAKEFNLRLFFAEKTAGHYMAGVRTTIQRNGSQPVLTVDAAGPWLYVALPPGRYKIVVEADGRQQARTVTLAAKRPSEVRFYWP